MTPRAGAIVVFAKQPRPGKVKTRMCPPLTPGQACELYAALLADVLEATARFARRLSLEAVLAVDPPSACSALARDAPARFRVVAQRGADLSERMTWAAREVAATGASRILLRGSDSPALDEKTVAEAVACLDDVDLAVCPDRDGGYALIALRDAVPGLFDHAMSTPSVLEDTLANAHAAGLRARTLGSTFDLDTLDDLRWLFQQPPSVTKLCSRTLDWLARSGVRQLVQQG